MEFIDIVKTTSGHIFANVMLWVTFAYFLFEALNFFSRGSFSSLIQRNRKIQPLLTSLMALIPGSGSTLFLFPMYKENKLSFAALTSAFIVTMGEAAFILLVREPVLYLWILLFSFIFALLIGYLLLIFFNEEKYIHNKENNPKVKKFSTKEDHRKETRGYHTYFHLVMPIIFYISWAIALPYFIIDLIEHNSGNDHSNLFLEIFSWYYLVVSIILILSFTINRLYFQKKNRINIPEDTTTTSNKMNKNALMDIVNRTYNQSMFIFVWVFISMMLVEIPFAYIPEPSDGNYQWMENIGYIVGVTFLVSFISFIPGCAVNIFIVSWLLTLSSQPGAIGMALPFSILLANSISQDGDAGYPLLSLNKRTYVVMKSVNILIGLIIGLVFIPLNGVLPGTIA